MLRNTKKKKKKKKETCWGHWCSLENGHYFFFPNSKMMMNENENEDKTQIWNCFPPHKQGTLKSVSFAKWLHKLLNFLNALAAAFNGLAHDLRQINFTALLLCRRNNCTQRMNTKALETVLNFRKMMSKHYFYYLGWNVLSSTKNYFRVATIC